MFSQAIFISYIVMIFLGLQGVTLVAILVKINNNRDCRFFNANRRFIIVSLSLGILYFITYYSDFVIGDFSTSRLYRLVDGMIFYAFGLSWIKVIDSFSDFEEKSIARLRRITNIIFGFFMIISSFSYGFLLDELYNTVNPYMDMLMIILELILVFLVLFFSMFYLHKANLKKHRESTRRYLTYVTIFVNISNAWNSLVVLAIFTKTMPVSILSTYSYGLTALFMLAVNSYILFYLYTTYSSIFYKNFKPLEETNSEKSAKKTLEIEEAMEETFICNLTERELEIMKLAYVGLTNPEIGEELFISRHTVKRHMHNIFEKMNVSTRLEMVHSVNRAMLKDSDC